MDQVNENYDAFMELKKSKTTICNNIYSIMQIINKKKKSLKVLKRFTMDRK